MYSVHYLEYYADRFITLRLVAHGLCLEQYLAAPAELEALYADRFLPLLPAQKLVQQQLDAIEAEAYGIEAQVTHLPCRNGAVIEPMHHHRFHKRSFKSFFEPRRDRP